MKTVLFLLGLSSAAAAQVTGTVRYEDRAYGGSGFTGTTLRPVRQARIEIVRSGDDAVLSPPDAATDGVGGFSVSGIAAGEIVYLRIYAQRTGNKINAVVRNNDVENFLYAVATAPIDTAVTTTFGFVDILISGGAAPAFNIFDCAVKSFEYLATIEPSLPAVPPPLQIYWQSGSSNGTYFDPPVNGVYLLGLTSDPDEYDDDIIHHEIGHWIATRFSRDDTLGGPHTVIDQLDPRTSWSEGWAHYWSAVVRRFVGVAEYAEPNLQVDNFGSGHSTFDIEGPSFPVQAVMATNELAVACVLWDITDAVNEGGFDALSGQEAEIWRTMSVQIPARTNITLEDFHAGLGVEAPGIMTGVTGTAGAPGIFKDRLIRYYADAGESNDPPDPPTLLLLGTLGLVERTFHAAADEDWYTLDATVGTLVLETRNLGDGANTVIQIYDAAGATLLDSNDNRSPADLSSLITRVILAPTTFLARILRTGPIVERGYYDVRAQVVVNGPPSITAISASATGGGAPLRVTFSASVDDSDGGAHEYQWDFNGDGIYDWSSFEGPTSTTVYDEAGTFIARLRVIDSGDSAVTVPLTVSVLPASPAAVSFSPTSNGTAPHPVAFNATVKGVVPTAYLWDVDSNGIYESASTESASLSFTFRVPGTYFPRLLIRDSHGRATRSSAGAIIVAAAASPPTIGSFTASSGLVPFASTMSVTHSDLGPSGTVEFDVDGDGRFDFIVTPGSAAGTTFTPEIQRAGDFTPRVRVTTSAGASIAGTASMSSRILGPTGWMVDPRGGDRLSGSSVTLTAQAVPAGVSKTVQFQVRDSALGGAWSNVGAPITSTGTLFSTTWDVQGLPALSSFDLRILIDGTASSGDTANVVVIDDAAPTISESGPLRSRTIRTDRTTISRNSRGVWAIVPLGSTSASLPLGLQPAPAPMANGSALGLRLRDGGWRVTFGGTFANTFRLRLPYTGDGSSLEIHHHDEASGVWQRLAFARVHHEDRWVEAEVNAAGVYALFSGRDSAGGSGGRCGATGLEAVVLLGIAAAIRRRPC